jgi:NADH-quinone oxidoreductase subunit C
MDHAAMIAALQEALPGVAIEARPAIDRHATFYAEAAVVPEVMRTLRDHPSLRCAVLAELTAADYWPRDPRFELIYILVSIDHCLRFRVKVRLGDEAHVATVSDIWPAANWLEREVWDLFGVAFDGHPDPRRLLMPEDWDGFPLRKDAPVQIQMKPNATQPLQVTAEEFSANVQKDRLARR